MSDGSGLCYKYRKEDDRIFLSEFIQTYRSLTALWDARSREYHDRQKKAKQYDILLQKYRERYPNAEKVDVTRKINILRTNFRREMKRLESFSEPGQVFDASRESSIWYFDELSFIKDSFYAIRGSKSKAVTDLHGIKRSHKVQRYNEDFQHQSVVADESEWVVKNCPVSSDESDSSSVELLENDSMTETSLQSNRNAETMFEWVDRKSSVDQARSYVHPTHDSFTSYDDGFVEDRKVKGDSFCNRLIKSEVPIENCQQSSISATDRKAFNVYNQERSNMENFKTHTTSNDVVRSSYAEQFTNQSSTIPTFSQHETEHRKRPRELREKLNELPTLQAKEQNNHDEQSSRTSLNACSESSDELNTTTDPLEDNRLACKRSKTQIESTRELIPLVTQQLEQQTDHLKMMTEVWASKLRQMSTTQQLYAEKFINDLLFEGLLGNLSRNSVQITH